MLSITYYDGIYELFDVTNPLISQSDTPEQLLRSRPFYDGETKIQKVPICSEVQPRESGSKGHALNLQILLPCC